MAIHLRKGPGKIKLVGKTEMVADLFDGPMSGVKQLHGPLHPQMVQIV
jgi:hypothetical protein